MGGGGGGVLTDFHMERCVFCGYQWPHLRFLLCSSLSSLSGVWAWWWGLMVEQPSVLGAFTGVASVAS